MRSTRRSEAQTRALIEKPTFALVAKDGGPSASAGPADAAEREARIRAAAYARFEARGGAHGHDLDDWLAAEAALSAQR